jgi:hypothetical protein
MTANSVDIIMNIGKPRANGNAGMHAKNDNIVSLQINIE